jgi:hypothetical protein
MAPSNVKGKHKDAGVCEYFKSKNKGECPSTKDKFGIHAKSKRKRAKTKSTGSGGGGTGAAKRG